MSKVQIFVHHRATSSVAVFNFETKKANWSDIADEFLEQKGEQLGAMADGLLMIKYYRAFSEDNMAVAHAAIEIVPQPLWRRVKN